MVSVIITTYNRPDMLQQAVESVIAQKSCHIEIIVVDDNSTKDNSFCIPFVSKYIKNNENKGLGVNHKIGFSESSGEYVCFMDDDDYYTDNDFYCCAIKYLEREPEIAMVCASSNNIYEPSLRIEPAILNNPEIMTTYEYLQGFGRRYRKPQSTFTTIFRRTSLIKAGFEKMLKPTDTCLYLRALTVYGKVFSINSAVGNYRIHEFQMTKAQNCDFIIEVLKEKKIIFDIVKDKLACANNWWYSQFRITFDYYCTSKPAKKELNKVIKWSFANSGGCVSLLRLLIKMWLKNNYAVRFML